MSGVLLMFLLLWLGIICSCCSRTRSSHAIIASSSSSETEDFSSYTFEQYLEDFEKSHDDDDNHDENNTNNNSRRAVFESNLAKINRHNNNQNQQQQQQHYKLGVNAFTDLLEDEVPMGYDKHLAAYLRQQRSGSLMMEQQENNMDAAADAADATATVRRRGRSLTNAYNEDWMTALGSSFTLEAIEDLPDTVDWRQVGGVTTAIKSQGICGSCWAFASTAVLESHVAIATSTLFELSVQQLVSCANNPHHCGGAGGCTGSTSELAFDHVQKYGGMVEEWSFGYQSFHGENVACSVEDNGEAAFLHKKSASSLSTTTAAAAVVVASIDGWVMLPRNNYEVVMNVLAKVGPLAVAVACSPWTAYHSGIYPHGNLTTQTETDLNHLVVLEGYGTDEATGLDFWWVRNSWGPKWGEHGRIRLERLDPKKLDSNDEHFCGMDTTPADGMACTIDDKGHAIQPSPSKICGNSGILYDVSFPIGAHLV